MALTHKCGIDSHADQTDYCHRAMYPVPRLSHILGKVAKMKMSGGWTSIGDSIHCDSDT